MSRDSKTLVRRRTVRALAVFAVLSTWLLAACSTTGGDSRTAPPPPVTRSAPTGSSEPAKPVPVPEDSGGVWREVEYSDLLVPTGFKYLEERSYTFEQDGSRMADLRYEGKMSGADTSAAFLKGLPAFGWRLKRISGLSTKVLTFEKDSEQAIISIMPGRETTQLRIMIHPWNE